MKLEDDFALRENGGRVEVDEFQGLTLIALFDRKRSVELDPADLVELAREEHQCSDEDVDDRYRSADLSAGWKSPDLRQPEI